MRSTMLVIGLVLGGALGFLARSRWFELADSAQRVREALAAYADDVPEATTWELPEPVQLDTRRHDVRMCRCGHSAEVHRHLRPGGDCGQCGPVWCAAFVADDTPPIVWFGN